MRDYALPKPEGVPRAASLPGAAAAGAHAPLSFGDVFAAHAGYVLGLLRRLGVSATDVEDVAQEVFIVIHTRLPSFEGRSSLKTWLCGICVRKAADYRRKAYRRREALLGPSHEPSTPAVAESDLERVRAAAQLERALSQLSEKHLQVFVLYELEELPMAEVARAVGCPRFTAYTRLHTARRKLRALFTADTPRRSR